MDLTLRYEVVESSQVGEARRAAASAARRLGFDPSDAERVALIVTELGTNLVKHATHGELVVVTFRSSRRIDVLSIDRGPGTDNPSRWLRDGFSTKGSAGTGLGAVSRLADVVDVYSSPDRGTVILARVVPRTGASQHARPGATAQGPGEPPDAAAVEGAGGVEIGGFTVPYPGEETCGDGWGTALDASAATLVMSDGLGHGPDAAHASIEAVNAFRALRHRSPARILDVVSERLRATRGAAVGVAMIERNGGVVRYAGIGNISGVIVSAEGQHSLVSTNGIVGQTAATAVREQAYPWPAGSVLVLHSDGLKTHWRLDDYPGLLRRDPAVIAAILYRDFARGTDDVGVVVARDAVAPQGRDVAASREALPAREAAASGGA